MDRLAKRHGFLQSDFAGVSVPSLPEIPGMITDAEGRYLYWLVSETYTGQGAIVELGCWLGRSTRFLAAGLRDSGSQGELHSFDRFVWIKEHAAKAPNVALSPGEDFQREFENNVRPVWPDIQAHKATFDTLSWSGGPIEILFLDGPKNFAAFSATLRAFGSSLSPGNSILVIQDYLHPVSFVLALLVDRLRDRLELIHVVEGGQTVSFRVLGPLEFPDGLPVEWELPNWSEAEILEAFERVSQPLAAPARSQIGLAPAFLLYESGHVDSAVRFIRGYEFTADEGAEWERWFKTGYYRSYPELFHATGHRRTQGSRLQKFIAPGGFRKLVRKLTGR